MSTVSTHLFFFWKIGPIWHLIKFQVLIFSSEALCDTWPRLSLPLALPLHGRRLLRRVVVTIEALDAKALVNEHVLNQIEERCEGEG